MGEGRINGIPPLLIASCILLRTAGKVSVRGWTEISLSIFLSRASPVSPTLAYLSPGSLLPFPVWVSFICRVLIAGKVEEYKAHRAVINNTVCWQQKRAEVYIYSRHGHIFIMETGNPKEELKFSTTSVQRSKSNLLHKLHHHIWLQSVFTVMIIISGGLTV